MHKTWRAQFTVATMKEPTYIGDREDVEACPVHGKDWIMEGTIVVSNTGEQLICYICDGCIKIPHPHGVHIQQPQATYERLIAIMQTADGALPN